MTAPNRDINSLHPIFREKVKELQNLIEEHKLPFERYECMRPRIRQGGIGMWNSYHQFGLAADFVGRINGKWSWDNSLPWKEYGQLVKSINLTWGGNFKKRNSEGKIVPFFDGPHCQIENYPLSGKIVDPKYISDVDEWIKWTKQFISLIDMKLPDDKKIYIQALQTVLNSKGSDLVVDGIYGIKTKMAQMSFGWPSSEPMSWDFVCKEVITK